MSTTKFLNVTTAPTCNSQNHIITAIPMLFMSPSWFFIPTDPQATFCSLLRVIIMVICALASQFSSISPVSRAHIPVRGAALTPSVFYFWPWHKEAGGGLVGHWCNVLGLHFHSALTRWHPEQLLVLQAPFTVRALRGRALSSALYSKCCTIVSKSFRPYFYRTFSLFRCAWIHTYLLLCYSCLQWSVQYNVIQACSRGTKAVPSSLGV